MGHAPEAIASTPRPAVRDARLPFVTLAGAAALYAAGFAVVTWPYVRHFGTAYWSDGGDGLENAWNLWWVRYALVVLHRSPWHTTYLHYPFGMSLHGHALGAFNGLLALPLAAVLGPAATYDSVVLFSFVAAGVTACMLAYDVTRGTVPAQVH